jgi:tetratricopeptide (TPR) repeat protein
VTPGPWARLGLVAGGLAAGLACLGALELGLCAVGVGGGPPAYDPMVGFSAAVPLFEGAERDGVPVFRVSPARLIDSPGAEPAPEREFLAEKPANGFRVFVVGESSAAGFPYPPAYAFGAWLGRRLAAALPDLAVEVVNAAIAGYSSRRALVAVREITRYEPDLFILYSGHNEWAERRYYSRLIDMHPWLFRLRERLFATRLFSVASHWLRRDSESPEQALARFVEGQREEFVEMFAVFSRRVEGRDYATPEEVAQRDALYRANLEEIARTARASGVPIVFITLAQNFADWAPGASTHRPGLGSAEEAEWRAHFERGARAARAGDCRAALEAWEEALALDDEHALLHYRIAGCERALERWQRARAHYRRASDLDRVPHGAPTAFNDVIRDVAGRYGALVADADAALVAASEHGLVGDDLMVEFAHPNLRAQLLIGAELERVLRDAGVPRPAHAWRASAWVDPAPEELLARDPWLRVREHEAFRFTCTVARRPDCVQEHVEALRRLGVRVGP